MEIAVKFQQGLFTPEEERDFLLGAHKLSHELALPAKVVDHLEVATAWKKFQPLQFETPTAPNVVFNLVLQLPGGGVWARVAQFAPGNFFRFTPTEKCFLPDECPWQRWEEELNLLHQVPTILSLFAIDLANELEKMGRRNDRVQVIFSEFVEQCPLLYCSTADNPQRFSLLFKLHFAKFNSMKTLKFTPPLISLILNGEKTTTWRLWDEKDLKVGETISFISSETKEEFTKAKLINVQEKPFQNLVDEDWLGHEKFKSLEEMYSSYSNLYKIEVNENTLVKIIHFELFNSPA